MNFQGLEVFTLEQSLAFIFIGFAFVIFVLMVLAGVTMLLGKYFRDHHPKILGARQGEISEETICLIHAALQSTLQQPFKIKSIRKTHEKISDYH